MTRFALFLVVCLASLGLFSCVRRQSPHGPSMPQGAPSRPEKAPHQAIGRVDDALPPDGFAPGWKATPGSYIYSASEDELWKIYNGAAPGVINQGGREAVTQGYQNREGGADKSFRVFILRFVDRDHALTFLKKETEGASDGEKLAGVDAGQIFDKGKAPWARFVIGPFLVSINWEGSTDDTDNSTLAAIRTISSKLRVE